MDPSVQQDTGVDGDRDARDVAGLVREQPDDGLGDVVDGPIRHFISKPYTVDALLQTLHRALGKS